MRIGAVCRRDAGPCGPSSASYPRIPMDSHNATPHFPAVTSRRGFLREAGGGFGALAAAWLLSHDRARGAERAVNPLAPRPPHFRPRAERVIYLFMHGGPSHLETF